MCMWGHLGGPRRESPVKGGGVGKQAWSPPPPPELQWIPGLGPRGRKSVKTTMTRNVPAPHPHLPQHEPRGVAVNEQGRGRVPLTNSAPIGGGLRRKGVHTPPPPSDATPPPALSDWAKFCFAPSANQKFSLVSSVPF